MKFGVNLGGHAKNFGGGFKAALWHIKGLIDLGHEVTIFSMTPIHPKILPYFSGIPIRWYFPGVEKEFAGFVTVNHFSYAQPLASEVNIQHLMFPALDAPPPDGLMLTANSKYTSEYIKYRFNRDAQVLYIPIEDHYRFGVKDKIILHVSRFAEPNAWADKAHMQMIQTIRMAYGQLPGWKLVMAGAVEEGQNSYLDSLMQIATGLPIEFVIDPTDEQIIDLYARASIYWHATGISLPSVASAQEHLGLAPLEASASGCVPIVYNSGGMPEVVMNRKTGLLFDDIKGMGQMTVELTRNLHLWSAYSQFGMMWAKSWTDYPAFVERLGQVIAGETVKKLPIYIPNIPSQSDVTIVIPTWNNQDMLTRCLMSVKATAPYARVLVMNNGDPIVVPDGVEVYDCGENLGFAGAYRVAEGLVDTPYVCLMNDDIEAIYGSWLEWMLIPMLDSEVGVVGSKLIFPDGKLQHAGGVIDWSREDIGYHRLYGARDCFEANIAQEMQFVTGACMLVRRELFHMPEELMGGLNFEDTWICMDAKEKGFKTVYEPASCLVHHEGVSKKKSQGIEDAVSFNKERFRERWQ